MILKIDSNLELRQLKLSDATDIFEIINSQREYLGKWLPFVAFTKELKDTQRFVDSIINVPKDKIEYTFSIRKESQLIGLIGLKNSDLANKKTEIGYWLSKEFQKQGIMTKSVEKICEFAFINQGFNKIQIKCAIENRSSSNILKKLGFKLEGIERDGELLAENLFTDVEVYSKLKNELTQNDT